MSGSRIEHARMAAASVIANLKEGDMVGVTAFSSGSETILPLTQVNGRTRAMLTNAVYRLRARGGTAMYAGLDHGMRALAAARGDHPVRRVILISDGHANEGPSSAYELGSLAAQATRFGGQVTTIGVGLGYDEHTLGAIAINSSGRFYHLEHPTQLATIMETEINSLSQVMAVNAYIEFRPYPGVYIPKIMTPGARRDNGVIILPLGSLSAGQERTLLLNARLPTGSTWQT